MHYRVEADQGSITTHSLGERWGATFTVQLPLLDMGSATQNPNSLPSQP